MPARRAASRARRRPGATVVALVLTALLASSPGAAGQEGSDPGESLREANEELSSTRASIQELARRVRAARAELDRIEADLADAEAELADIEERVAAARAREREAAAAVQEAGERLAAARERVEAAVARRDRHLRRVESQVAHTYKHGPMSRLEALASSYTGARSLHDAAVAERAIRVSFDQQGELVARADDLVLAAEEARRELASLRRQEQVRQRRREDALREVQALADRQERVVDRIARRRAEQQELIASFEADRLKRLALARQLNARMVELGREYASELAARYTSEGFDGPAPSWMARLPGDGSQWARLVVERAGRWGVDPRLFAALVWTESYFRPTAVSHAGAIGLAQLMPGTASALGVDPWDPAQNLEGGARYLRAQLDRFERLDLALAAYNAGPEAVARAGNRVPEIVETQFYVLRVLARYEKLLDAG